MLKNGWVFYALLAAVTWGLWGFVDKVVIEKCGWPVLVFGSALSYVVLTPLIIGMYGKTMWPTSGYDWFMVILGAAAACIGMIFFYLALAKGNASKVVPLTAIYPAITVLLSLAFLREKPNIFQIIGIGLAVIAVVFLSIDNKKG